MALGEYLGAGSGTTKGLYHLNGNANDSSGNGYNGTTTNIVWYGGRLGSGSAGFNGASSYITLTNFQNATEGTFSVLANFGSVLNNKLIFADDGAGYVSMGIYPGVDGRLFFQSFDTTGRTAYIDSITTGVWYHIVGTYKSGETTKLYINGNLVANSGSTGTGLGNTGTAIRLGKSGTNYYGGYIDEFFYENRRWTAAEIRKYYTYVKGRFGIN